MDINELKAQHPKLVEAVTDEARQGYVKAEDAASQASAAGAAERERVVGLATVLMGEDAGAKFKAAVDANLTAEQAKALGVSLVSGDASAKQKEMLAALQQAHGEGVGPAQGQDLAGGKDFLTLVKEYQAQHQCDRATAVLTVAKAHPQAHAAYVAQTKPSGGKE